MHTPIRELALAVVFVSGSASAFAPGALITHQRPAAAVERSTASRLVSTPPLRAARLTGAVGLQSALQNADKINRVAPRNWVLGTDYVKATKLSPGDLVLVERSDGTRRYGEVLKSTGPFSKDYEIVVEVERGQASSTKIENLSNCFVPTGATTTSGSTIAAMSSQRTPAQARTVRAPPPPRGRTAPAKTPAKTAAAAAAAAVPNAAILQSKSVPATWVEGTDFVKAAAVKPGDLVVVDGVRGLFFGTVEKKTGLPWQQQFSVVVQVMTDGSAAARETADISTLYIPDPAALEALTAPPPPAAAIGGFFKNLFGGSEEAPPPPPPKPAAPQDTGTSLSNFLPKEAGTMFFELQKKVTGETPPPPPPAKAAAKTPQDTAKKGGFLGSLASNPAFKDLGLDGVAETLEELKSGTKKTETPPPAPPAKAAAKAPEIKIPDIKSVDEVQKKASEAAGKAQEQFKSLASGFLTNLEQVIDEKLPADKAKKDAPAAVKKVPPPPPPPATAAKVDKKEDETKKEKKPEKKTVPPPPPVPAAAAAPPPPPPAPAAVSSKAEVAKKEEKKEEKKVESKEAPAAKKEAAAKKETPPPAPPAPKAAAKKETPPPAPKEAPQVEAKEAPKVSSGPQKPPKAELPEDKWCDAKKNALTVNLERAEREADLNLGLGPEWDAFVKQKK